MADDTSPPPAPPQQLLSLRSPEHKIVYADSFTIRATPVDFQITFGVQSIIPVGTPQTGPMSINAIIEQFTVAMPLPILKALSLHLAKDIEIIEEMIGKVAITAASQFTEGHEQMVRNNLMINPLILE